VHWFKADQQATGTGAAVDRQGHLKPGRDHQQQRVGAVVVGQGQPAELGRGIAGSIGR
jgi:hypothetical protein